MLVSKSRQRDLMPARFAAYWLMHNMRPDMSTPQIGQRFDRDHGTIIHGKSVAAANIDQDEGYRDMVELARKLCVA